MQQKTRLITIQQLQLAVFICLLTDIIINPRTSPMSVSASAMVIGMVISSAVLAILTIPIFYFVKRFDICKLLSEDTFRGKIVSSAILLLIAMSAAQGVVQAESFYRFVSDNLLPVWLFIALVIIVAIYGAKMGLEPMVRTGVIVSVLIFISIAFIVVANVSQFHLENLEYSDNVFEYALFATKRMLKFPSEIFIYALLTPQLSKKTTKSFVSVLPAVVAVFLLVVITQELVLGSFSSLHLQPLYTLARIGSISVFTRIDAIHVSVWMMLAIFRIAIHFLLMNQLAKTVFKFKNPKMYMLVSAIVLMAFTLISFGVKQYNFDMWISIANLFLVSIIPIVFMKERKMYEIKNDS